MFASWPPLLFVIGAVVVVITIAQKLWKHGSRAQNGWCGIQHHSLISYCNDVADIIWSFERTYAYFAGEMVLEQSLPPMKYFKKKQNTYFHEGMDMDAGSFLYFECRSCCSQSLSMANRAKTQETNSLRLHKEKSLLIVKTFWVFLLQNVENTGGTEKKPAPKQEVMSSSGNDGTGSAVLDSHVDADPTFAGLFVFGAPIRRYFYVRHYRDPLWPISTTKIENQWDLIRIVLADLGVWTAWRFCDYSC